jgi:hypothetical protein
MRSWLAVLLGSFLAILAVDARKVRHPPWVGGMFLVKGAPLVLGRDGIPIDRVRIGQGQFALDDCAGTARVKGTRISP